MSKQRCKSESWERTKVFRKSTKRCILKYRPRVTQDMVDIIDCGEGYFFHNEKQRCLKKKTGVQYPNTPQKSPSMVSKLNALKNTLLDLEMMVDDKPPRYLPPPPPKRNLKKLTLPAYAPYNPFEMQQEFARLGRLTTARQRKNAKLPNVGKFAMGYVEAKKTPPQKPEHRPSIMQKRKKQPQIHGFMQRPAALKKIQEIRNARNDAASQRLLIHNAHSSAQNWLSKEENSPFRMTPKKASPKKTSPKKNTNATMAAKEAYAILNRLAAGLPAGIPPKQRKSVGKKKPSIFDSPSFKPMPLPKIQLEKKTTKRR